MLCMMLLKSDKSRWGGEKRWWGRVIYLSFWGPVSVYLRLCTERGRPKFVSVCFFFSFLFSAKHVRVAARLFQRGYYAFVL